MFTIKRITYKFTLSNHIISILEALNSYLKVSYLKDCCFVCGIPWYSRSCTLSVCDWVVFWRGVCISLNTPVTTSHNRTPHSVDVRNRGSLVSDRSTSNPRSGVKQHSFTVECIRCLVNVNFLLHYWVPSHSYIKLSERLIKITTLCSNWTKRLFYPCTSFVCRNTNRWYLFVLFK